MTGTLFRILGSLAGALVMSAAWLAAVLARMPRPPVPPSFAVTLTAPIFTAAGFALGMSVVSRLAHRPQGEARGTFLWTLVGCTAGTVLMFRFGGMFAGFGTFGGGMAALLAREAIEWRGGRRRAER